MKNNTWRWQARNAKGEVVESSPGKEFFESRGPESKAGMIQAAKILLYNKRVDAINEGLEDPGYQIDESSVHSIGAADLAVQPLGSWMPGKASPVNLPTDATVNAAREARLLDE